MRHLLGQMPVKVLVIIVLSAVTLRASSDPQYLFTDLAPQAGQKLSAAAWINDAGKVVVNCTFPDPPGGSPWYLYTHAYLWQNAKISLLPALPTGGFTHIMSINTADTMLGYADIRPYKQDTNANSFIRDVLWSGGTITDLGDFQDGWYASAMNDSGDLAGEFYGHQWIGSFSQTYGHAYLRQGTQMVDLSPDNLYMTSVAWGLNNLDQVVGHYHQSNSSGAILSTGACVWNRDIATQQFVMTGLGTLGGVESEAVSVNDSGQIVGDSETAQHFVDLTPCTHAFLWQNGKMTDLGVLPRIGTNSNATHINNNGQITGLCAVNNAIGNGSVHAVVWQNNQIVDLNTAARLPSGWTLYSAECINNDGLIVGWGYKDGKCRGYLLTPIKVQSLTMRPSILSSGQSAVAVVTLSVPAPAGGVTVPISVSDPSVLFAQKSVTIPAGMRSVNFPVRANKVAKTSAVTVSATNGYVTQTAAVTVKP